MLQLHVLCSQGSVGSGKLVDLSYQATCIVALAQFASFIECIMIYKTNQLRSVKQTLLVLQAW